MASGLIGCPSVGYRYGQPDLGISPDTGFDCSGFVVFVLNKVGLAIPNFIGMDGTERPIRHSSEMWDHYGVTVHEEVRQPGDLIFFSRNGLFPSHVGIVSSTESYIHAPGKRETRVEACDIDTRDVDGDQEGAIFVRNPIGFKSPVAPATKPTYRNHQRII